MPEYDARELDARETGRIVKTAVTPRPIAWISTVDDDGNENLAPFSSYTYVNLSRPVVQFNSTFTAEGVRKDTALNILQSEEFALNVVTADAIEAMDQTSASLPREESEFAFADVDGAPCRRIAPPRVADAPVTMECTLYDTMEVYDSLAILGDVEYVHVAPEVMVDGAIDARVVDTVGRLGGPFYSVSEPVQYEREF